MTQLATLPGIIIDQFTVYAMRLMLILKLWYFIVNTTESLAG